MIVKLARKGMSGHMHIVECDGLHIDNQVDEKEDIIYSRIICYLNGNTIREWHGGRIATDYLYIMDKGKTVDKMTFHYPVKNPGKQ